jgi:hypothetical protein
MGEKVGKMYSGVSAVEGVHITQVYANCPERREIITVRGQSYVLRLPEFDPRPPSPPGQCVPPALVAGGRTHSPGGEGGGGVNILEDARHSSELEFLKNLWGLGTE